MWQLVPSLTKLSSWKACENFSLTHVSRSWRPGIGLNSGFLRLGALLGHWRLWQSGWAIDRWRLLSSSHWFFFACSVVRISKVNNIVSFSIIVLFFGIFEKFHSFFHLVFGLRICCILNVISVCSNFTLSRMLVSAIGCPMTERDNVTDMESLISWAGTVFKVSIVQKIQLQRQYLAWGASVKYI